MSDKLDTRGDFSWNMYSRDYQCRVAYTISTPGRRGQPLDVDELFSRHLGMPSLNHRDGLPAFRAYLCREISRWGTITAQWDRFWYAEGSTCALGLFRIAFACSLLLEISTTAGRSTYAIADGFHLPYWSVIPLVSPETYHLIHLLQIPCGLLLALGLFHRPACLALLFLQGWIFFADQLNFRNHPYFFLLLLFLLLFVPADDALSLRSLWRAAKRDLAKPSRWEWRRLLGTTQPLTFQRLIQLQLCLVYGFAGLQKLNPALLGGDVLSRYLVASAPRVLEGFFSPPPVCSRAPPAYRLQATCPLRA